MMQVSVPQCKVFAEQRGEKLSEAMLSVFFENIVLHELSIEQKDSDIFNDIVSYSIDGNGAS